MKNKRIRRGIAFIISIFVILQLFPISALATLVMGGLTTDASINETNTVPDVVAEIVEERDEFSKVYLLEDGSYYKISTYAPIHEKINGEWESIDEDVDEITASVSKIEKNLQEASVELFQTSSDISLLSDSPVENEESSLLVNCIKAEFDANDESKVIFNGKATILAKPQHLNYYLNNNKIVIEAKLSANCSPNTTHRKTIIKLYESSITWDQNTTAFPSGFVLANEKLIDYNTVETANTYYWDITDLYNRWDRGTTVNNGFLLHSETAKCSLTLSSMCISVRYKNIDEKDLDSTYHIVDMGRAGIVYVNDITNTVKVEQNILTIDRTVLPISLKRIYNLSQLSSANSAGVGFRWNYESQINFDGELVSWKMFDGTVRYYVKTEEVNGDYQKWEGIGKVTDLSMDDSAIWVKSVELSKEVYDYSNFYAEINNEKYNFDTYGNLIRLEVGENGSYAMCFNYSNGMLASITCSENSNTIMTISFDFTSNGNGYVTLSLDPTDDSSQQIVSFSTSTDETTNATTNVVTYNDNEQIYYQFNSNGELTEIINVDGTRLQLSYFVDDYSEAGNRLSKYEKVIAIDSQNVIVDSLNFEINNTYQRIMTNKDGKKEFIQYDTSFNVVTHQNFDGDYTFATYDSNNIINSYTVGESDTTELLENADFEELDDVGEAISWSSEEGAVTAVEIEDIETCPNWNNSNDNTYHAQFISADEFTDSFYQVVEGLQVDQTYVFGAWIYIDEALPSSKRNISVNIKNANDEDDIIATIKYDTTAPKQWQFRMGAFKLYDEIDVLLSIDYDGQEGSVYADNITLHQSSIAQSDISNIISESPYIVTENDDGLVDSEKLYNGVTSLIKSYDYDNNQVSAITDINGVTTYYDYNENDGSLEEIGNKKTGDTIINPTVFVYADGLRTSIQQMVTDIITKQKVSMVTQYSYNNDRIESVTHNGFAYEFVYDNYGNLISVDMSSENYVKSDGESKLIEYTYEDDCIGEINYKNGLTIRYTCENAEIKSLKYYLNSSEPIKEIEYTYNEEGFLVVEDSQTNLGIEYTSTGYKLYKQPKAANEILYIIENNIDGSTTEFYYPNLYRGINGEEKVVVETSGVNASYNAQTKETTTCSTVSVSKGKNWKFSEDVGNDCYYVDEYDAINYTYERQSVTDYFGRVVQKSIEMQSVNSDGETSRVAETYSYKELLPGITSTLVSSYSASVDMFNKGTLRTVYSNDSFYEYDHNGNIVFEYSKDDNGETVLKKYYEYDEAQQIIGEVNFEKGIAVTYTYDVGGNLTAKNYHNYDVASENVSDAFETCYESADKSFAIESGISKYGAIVDTVTLGYDNTWKDRLVNYNGQIISYDSFGNPINYVGSTCKISSIGNNPSQTDDAVTGTIEWLGDKMAAFETTSARYEYEYDDNGYRTRKLVFDKELVGTNFEYSLESETVYVWDNGALKSVIFDSCTDDKPLQSDIIYDQEGNMAGYVSYTGVAIYFVKDSNGSVKGLIDNNGTTIAVVSYDVWGVPSITIPVDTSTTSGNLSYIACSILTLINPSTYNGYLFDYETGLYFNKERIYSPSWGRYLNMVEFSSLLEETNNAVASNLYTFCNNNPVNVFDVYGAWYRNDIEYTWMAEGFSVPMSEAFLSRLFCIVFANQLIKTSGNWDYNSGYSYCGMETNDIAVNLFAHSVGKYALSAVNKVNATWGDGWIVKNSKSDVIEVFSGDSNMWKYKKIWNAAPDIKMHAWSQGIYITL